MKGRVIRVTTLILPYLAEWDSIGDYHHHAIITAASGTT